MSARALELPDPLQDGFDAGFHGCVHAWRATSFPTKIGFVLWGHSTLEARLRTGLLSASALIFRVIILVLFFLLFFFVIVGQGIGLWNLS
jgi:hypothetical protein